MSGGRVERRLAAILAGDIAGYSGLMGADEEGTLRTLKELRYDHLRCHAVALDRLRDLSRLSATSPR